MGYFRELKRQLPKQVLIQKVRVKNKWFTLAFRTINLYMSEKHLAKGVTFLLLCPLCIAVNDKK